MTISFSSNDAGEATSSGTIELEGSHRHFYIGCKSFDRIADHSKYQVLLMVAGRIWNDMGDVVRTASTESVHLTPRSICLAGISW